MIQLRLRERALLRQGQLSEPQASSGPAAMLLAISRNLSCIPPTESLPGPISSPSGVPLSLPPHGTLVVSPDGVLAQADILSLWRSVFHPPSGALIVSS